MGPLLAILLLILSAFLILLVLVQRGRGGGLAGALGGMGGSSAFGAKAGDVFTRITIITAAAWILLGLAAVYWAEIRRGSDALSTSSPVRAADENIPSPRAGGATPAPSSSRESAPVSSPENKTPPAEEQK